MIEHDYDYYMRRREEYVRQQRNIYWMKRLHDKELDEIYKITIDVGKYETMKYESVEEIMDKCYGRINKFNDSITRERTKRIVEKLNYMAQALFDHFKWNSKKRKHNDKALITYRILNNPDLPEAGTVPTIYSLYGAMCLMYKFYKKDPNNIFNWALFGDFYPCRTIMDHNSNKGLGIDDKEIEEAYDFLMNLSDEEIEKRICNNIIDGQPVDTKRTHYSWIED